MSLARVAERTLTQLDYVRLTRLLAFAEGEGRGNPMQEVLAASDLVASPAVPPDVVTMYSQILVLPEGASTPVKLTLCYPADAEPSRGFISVLSPLGMALLGRRRGELVSWTAPDARERETQIVDLLFQPEASGDYTT